MNATDTKLRIGSETFDVSDITKGTAQNLPSMIVHGTAFPESIPGRAHLLPSEVEIQFHGGLSLHPEPGQHPVRTRVHFSIVAPAP
jgi:hypothetical protein